MGIPQLTFVTPVPFELLCPICHETLEEPLTLNCGHNVCRLCIEDRLSTDTGFARKCPTCFRDVDITEAHSMNGSLKKVYLRLKRRCRYGCSQILTIETEATHSHYCKFNPKKNSWTGTAQCNSCGDYYETSPPEEPSAPHSCLEVKNNDDILEECQNQLKQCQEQLTIDKQKNLEAETGYQTVIRGLLLNISLIEDAAKDALGQKDLIIELLQREIRNQNMHLEKVAKTLNLRNTRMNYLLPDFQKLSLKTKLSAYQTQCPHSMHEQISEQTLTNGHDTHITDHIPEQQQLFQSMATLTTTQWDMGDADSSSLSSQYSNDSIEVIPLDE